MMITAEEQFTRWGRKILSETLALAAMGDPKAMEWILSEECEGAAQALGLPYNQVLGLMEPLPLIPGRFGLWGIYGVV